MMKILKFHFCRFLKFSLTHWLWSITISTESFSKFELLKKRTRRPRIAARPILGVVVRPLSSNNFWKKRIILVIHEFSRNTARTRKVLDWKMISLYNMLLYAFLFKEHKMDRTRIWIRLGIFIFCRFNSGTYLNTLPLRNYA